MDRDALVRELLGPLVEELPGGCWRWHGSKTPAHRLFFEVATGASLAGRVLRPLCQTRACVNPGHFRSETYREMVAAGDTPVGRNMRRSTCLRGHSLLDEANVLVSGGQRVCRACLRLRVARSRARRREETAA